MVSKQSANNKPEAQRDSDAGRRERNKREKQERIISAARTLFREQGFGATTMQQIAARARVGVGTVFLYVTCKEELLVLAFADEVHQVLEQAMATMPTDQGLIEQVIHYFQTLLHYHEQDFELSRVLLRETGIMRRPEQPWFDTLPMLDYLEQLVQKAQQRGEINGAVEVRLVALNFFSAYWFCLREWSNGWTTASGMLAMLRGMVATQCAGVLRR